ncbi:hypothetical protein UA08_05347 [Talaromyces atroroseus]|uniref:Uncharacterized protein n=1 Tax=Talaromyces atroroseus TaxID=1441469 RepID=A0A225AEB7_TALAT|nr:hypothetical protein UA08_05347 [Talaromyces atroroseus]OKL59591.1 hypothetical protein UA08_05347 [Talaromyces atroroseus]
MHKPSIAQIVYNATFPRPKSADPTSFSVHITRNLVPEVRIETSAFYGSLDCIEAQYPGLDYSYGPHRMRLSRFPWHRKLFKVFDDLRLTEAEIASLCRWEGTKSARERYEKEEGVKVNDTTADDVRPATPAPFPSARFPTDDEATISDSEYSSAKQGGPVQELLSIVTTQQNETEDGDFSDEEMESYGVQLNQRLIYATAARERGNNMPLDEDWEQWLKEAVERGSYSDMLNAVRTGQPLETRSHNPASPIPSSPGAALMNQLALAAQQPVAVQTVHPASVFRHPSTSSTSGVAR